MSLFVKWPQHFDHLDHSVNLTKPTGQTHISAPLCREGFRTRFGPLFSVFRTLAWGTSSWQTPYCKLSFGVCLGAIARHPNFSLHTVTLPDSNTLGVGHDTLTANFTDIIDHCLFDLLISVCHCCHMCLNISLLITLTLSNLYIWPSVINVYTYWGRHCM